MIITMVGKVVRGIVILVLVGMSILLPFVGFGFLCSQVARRIHLKLSYLENLLVAILLTAMINIYVYEALNAISVYPKIWLIGLLYSLIATVLFVFAPRKSAKQPFILQRDIAVAAVMALTFAFLLSPVVLRSNNAPSRSIEALHIMSNGEDNASHFALYKYAYLHDGYAYGQPINQAGLINSLINYPQGSEFTISWLAKSVLGNHYATHNGVLLLAYYGLCSAVYSVMAGMAVLVGFVVYDRVRKRPPDKAQLVILATLGFLLFSVTPFLQLMGGGFQSQIAAYVYLLGILLILCSTDGFSKQKVIALLLLGGGVCTSWWFLAPTAAVPILWWLYSVRKSVRVTIPLFAGVIIAAGFAIYPVLLSIFSPVTTAYLNEDGGIPRIATVTLMLYALGVATLWLPKKRRLQYSHPVFVTLTTGIVFSLLVAAYQLSSLGHLAYYYYKSIYTLLPLASILLFFNIAVFYDEIIAIKIDQRRLLAAAMIFLLVCGMLFVSVKPSYHHTYTRDAFPFPLSYGGASTLLNITAKHDTKDVVFIGNCNLASTYAAVRWGGALLLSENDARHQFGIDTLNNKASGIRKYFKAGQKEASSIAVANPEGCNEGTLVQYVKMLGYNYEN